MPPKESGNDTLPANDQVITEASQAANRLFAEYPESARKPVEEGGYLQGEHHEVMFDPNKRGQGSQLERGMRAQLTDAAIKQAEMADQLVDTHTQLHQAEEKHELQRHLHARMHARFKEESRIDLATQARNKNAFKAEFSEMVETAVKERKPLGAVFGDIDGFKKANDTLGHDKGDEILSIVAEAIQSHIRDDDILYRYAGDEFVVLMPDFKSPKDIPPDRFITIRTQAIQEEIQKALRDAGFPVDELGLNMSMGGGILTPGESAAAFIRRIDTYMYEQKRERKRMQQNSNGQLSSNELE